MGLLQLLLHCDGYRLVAETIECNTAVAQLNCLRDSAPFGAYIADGYAAGCATGIELPDC